MSKSDPSPPAAQKDGARSWTFLTNHGHVLNCIANDPDALLREVADRVGITERAAQAILLDLVEGGYVSRTRVGRRNRYEVHPERPFRHPVEGDHRVGELLQVLGFLDQQPSPRVGPAKRRRG